MRDLMMTCRKSTVALAVTAVLLLTAAAVELVEAKHSYRQHAMQHFVLSERLEVADTNSWRLFRRGRLPVMRALRTFLAHTGTHSPALPGSLTTGVRDTWTFAKERATGVVEWTL